MTPTAFFLILASAGLHATWNMIAKRSGMTLAFYAMLGLIGLIWSSFVRLASPLAYCSQPPQFYAWLAGMLIGEGLYASGIIHAYRRLDMSTAYPMMRSLPLLFLALITTSLGIGRPLGCAAVIGMAIVFVGCLLMPLAKFSDFSLSRYADRSLFYILVVAAGTTIYTLCDSEAQAVMRAAAPDVSRTLVALTYYAFRAATLTTALWIAVFCSRKTRAEAVALVRRPWIAVAAGVCSSLTYVSVLVAMNFVSNVSFVQTFRQIGLLIGMFEGVFILREKCTGPKIAGLVLILCGLVISVL